MDSQSMVDLQCLDWLERQQRKRFELMDWDHYLFVVDIS